MLALLRRSSFDISLETLRRDHAHTYRRWVLVGLVVSLIGYTASCLIFVLQQSWAAALASGDPFVVLADLLALALVARGHPRTGASVAVAAAFVDVHFSLIVLQMPTLANVGLVVPAFVLTAGLLFGGHVAISAALVLVISVPATLWVAALRRPGTGLDDPSVVRFLVVLEVVLWATTALVAILLRTAAQILEQHRESEARSRALQAQLLHAQKLEALGLLAGGVAHDFNNLLAAIAGYGSLLEQSSDPRARELGTEIVSTQRRGATLTRQLLAFARKDTAQPRPMDLERTLANLATLLRRAVGDQVQLHVESEPGCTIVADPGRIEQVLLNLAVNARDAMPEGGRLWIRCGVDGGRVRLEVEDEGVGMDEQVQARVFEPFFTTKGRDRGTGLGLSTVHGIVADSGGSIELHSRVRHGTRFIVHWPRAALVPEPAGDDAQVELDGAGRSVLLVEDNDGARVYFQRLLAERGFLVTAARSAEEATALLAPEAGPPDLVVTDVILPGLSGPDLIRELSSRWPSLRCLFVSGYLGDVALGAGFDAATDLVLKPFTASELLTAIAGKLAAHPGVSPQP
jgi:signal transduction histidine kinase/CheY-like chemotaxis protein